MAEEMLHCPTNCCDRLKILPQSTAPSTDDGVVYYDTEDAKFYFRQAGDWAELGGAGAVSSVFTRTGAVVAAINDYTWAQIDKTTSDIADIATRSHASLTDIGTNTHAQIDTDLLRLANTSGTNTGNQIVPANEPGAANNFLTAYNNATGAWTKAQPTWANIDKTTSDIADLATKAHSSLTSLDWASAGHTIAGNTMVDFNSGGVAKTLGYVTANSQFEFGDRIHATNVNTAESGANAIGTRDYTAINGTTAGIGGAVNYANIANDGTLTLNGTARKYKSHCQTGRDLYGIAGTFNTIVCTAATLSSLSSRWIGYAFADGAGANVADAIITAFTVPHDYVDGSDIKINLQWTAAAITGNVFWGIGLMAVGAAENMVGTTTYQTGTSAAPGTTWYKQSFTVTFTGTGIAAGDDLSIVVYRSGDNVEDTMSGDAFVTSVNMKYLSDKWGSST